MSASSTLLSQCEQKLTVITQALFAMRHDMLSPDRCEDNLRWILDLVDALTRDNPSGFDETLLDELGCITTLVECIRNGLVNVCNLACKILDTMADDWDDRCESSTKYGIFDALLEALKRQSLSSEFAVPAIRCYIS